MNERGRGGSRGPRVKERARREERRESERWSGETRVRTEMDGWRKVLYGEYGAAVRRVFIAAAICRPIVITALSNPSYDCMCHAGSMLRPRHRASLRTRIHHFFATAKRVDPFLLPSWSLYGREYIYIRRAASSPFFVDRPSVNYREREREAEPK